MAVAWPTAGAYAIPYESNRESFQVAESGSPLLSSEMQSGKTRDRRQFTQSKSAVSMTITLKAGTELENWNRFLKLTTFDGAADFYMPVYRPSQGTYTTYLCKIRGGANGVTVKAHGATQYDVTFTLDVYGYEV